MKKAGGGCRNVRPARSVLLLLMVLLGLVVTFNILVLNNAASMYASNSASAKEDTAGFVKASTSDSGNVDYDYDEIYASFGTHESYMDRRMSNFDSFGNYTSPAVLSAGCRLTVSIIDPRPPTSGYNHPMWFALESVALYAPYACVVFHTASCDLNIVETKNLHNEPTSQQRTALVAQSIYDRSLPLSRRMMENGLVRINILDSNKYGTEACNNFGKGNSILLNIYFWLEEFIEGVDSNMILTLQPDSVLCHDFDITLWKHYAYVGAPWAAWIWNCGAMRERWYEYAPKCNGLENYRTDDSMAQICTPGHGGLQGNGGLSLRNKIWMVEAISRCPSEFSGLTIHQKFGEITEDIFFSTVLNALNASMPSAFEASLFSVESIFPEELSEQSGPHARDHFKLNNDEITSTIERLWGKDKGMLLYNRMHRHDSNNNSEHTGKGFTIPLAFHQPWNGIAYSTCGFPIRDKSTRDNSECAYSYILSEPNIIRECKFLKYIYNHRGISINK
jgi:hypothetical protein